MFRKLLRRYGIAKTVLGLTLASILLSIGITWSINALMYGGSLGDGLVVAILAPTIIAPLMSIQMLRLLEQLDRAEQQLQILSNTDELTQAYNRRYFIPYSEKELRRAQRHGETFSIAILDLDNFKQINDMYGHLVGDQFLRELSRMFKAQIRETDIFARYGGDEFIFLFPQMGREQTEHWARRIFEEFTSIPMKVEGLEILPAFSIGIVVFGASADNFDDLLRRADAALYQVKKNGGNSFLFA
jgi:diguanylate cyclase (GGDEF)-like protein